MASVTDDTTTIKMTEYYRKDRTTYKRNSGLFFDTTAQRFVFYFFSTTHFLKTILASRTSGTFGFARHTSRPFAKLKEPFFATVPIIFLILQNFLQVINDRANYTY